MRLLLILLLTAAMDLGSPVLPGGEGFEEFEEAAHGRRRLARLASATLPRTAAEPDPAHRVTPLPRTVTAPARPAFSVGPPKRPPRLDSSRPSSPDDH